MADQVLTKQKLINADEDLGDLEEVLNGPPGKLIKTRLGREVYTLASVPQINTMTREEVAAAVAPKANKADVDTALSNLSTTANKYYSTLAAANADIANIALNQSVTIGEEANSGLWEKKTAGATSLTKSAYDPLNQAKEYADANPLFKPKLIGDNDSLDTYLTAGEYHKNNYTNATPEYGFPTVSARGVLKVSALTTLTLQFFTVYDTGVTYTRRYSASTGVFHPWRHATSDLDLKDDKFYTQLEWQGRSGTSVVYDKDTKTVSINGLHIAAYASTSASVRFTNISVQLPEDDPDYALCYIDLLAMNADNVTAITSANKDLYIKVGRYVDSSYRPEVGKVPLFKYDATQGKPVPCAGFPRITVLGDTEVIDGADSYPLGFYENTPDTLIAYSQVKQNLYVGFRVVHMLDTDELIYTDYWCIIGADFYTLEDGEMIPTGQKAITPGESEFVIRHNDQKDDATGGIHGDEKLIDVLFLADGLPVDISVAHNLTACRDVEYIIKSNLHETAEGGIAIAGHPIIAEHWKRTKFEDGGYTTNNKVFWKYDGLITHFHHGISCLAKDVATTVMTGQSLTQQDMSGSLGNYFNEVGASEYIGWNSTTGLSVHADSRLIQNSVSDSVATLFVWDRVPDSKYYCRDSPFQSINGAITETEFTCRFGSK